MSIGFVEDEQAMIWRGPMLHSAMRQFLGDVIWGDLDYLFIDMPPGTGDVQLSLSQITSLRGTVVVTTPQEVALSDVKRSISMCNRMETPLLGIVENMSYYIDDSGKKIEIFGSGGGEKISQKLGTNLLGQIRLILRFANVEIWEHLSLLGIQIHHNLWFFKGLQMVS